MAEHATEMDVARAIMRGELDSPQQYENSWFYAIRITGTGVSYRAGLKEYVFRDPSVFLEDAFVERCAGLPVILIHPEKSLLNAEEYANRNVGSIMLPYRQGDEVWGIARLFDGDVVAAMREGNLSTSPGVRFPPGSEELATAQLDDDRLTIEGNPSLVDHIAIVPAGVWDKGGPPSGIRNDAMPDKADSAFDDLVKKLEGEGHSKESATKIAAKVGNEKIGAHEMAERAAQSRARNDSEKDKPMADEKKPEGDGARKDAAQDLMDKLDAMCSRMDAIGARMDAMEAPKDKKDAEDEKPEAKAEEKAEDKKDAEADEKAKEEAKEAKDAKDAAVAASAAMADQIKAMQAKIDALTAPPSYEDMDRLSAAQTRADGVLQMLGERPEKPYAGESSVSYRKRILAKLRRHSDKLKDISVDALDGVILDQIEGAIYADAQVAARNPAAGRAGVLIPVVTDDGVRKITRYYGDSKVWRDAFSAKPIAVSMHRPAGGLN
ncbi:MAG: hypothetical protein ACYC3L_00880 [Gemmatimonadaceae bacterium]